jgi:hypothetical protein
VQWVPVGQEQSFVQTHALLLTTTYVNSLRWEQQAQGSPGVTSVEVAPAVACK